MRDRLVRPGYLAVLVVALMVGCAALTGCVSFATAGCDDGMERRGDMCEGFKGHTWWRVPARGA